MIPGRDTPSLSCPGEEGIMSIQSYDNQLGWRWRYNWRYNWRYSWRYNWRYNAGEQERSNGSINPTKGSFIENEKFNIQRIVVIIMSFVKRETPTKIKEIIDEWRQHRGINSSSNYILINAEECIASESKLWKKSEEKESSKVTGLC